KPIERTVFGMDEPERAFRHMTSGKHIGKVLIQIRPEEIPFQAAVTKPEPVVVQALGRTWFNPYKVGCLSLWTLTHHGLALPAGLHRGRWTRRSRPRTGLLDGAARR